MSARCNSVDSATGLRCKWPAGHDGLHSADRGGGKAQHWGSLPVSEIEKWVERWKKEAEGDGR